LQIELTLQAIPFVAQPELLLEYKGNQLSQFFKPDFICYGKFIVELKVFGTARGCSQSAKPGII
jgi:GxxExxY protein